MFSQDIEGEAGAENMGYANFLKYTWRICFIKTGWLGPCFIWFFGSQILCMDIRDGFVGQRVIMWMAENYKYKRMFKGIQCLQKRWPPPQPHPDGQIALTQWMDTQWTTVCHTKVILNINLVYVSQLEKKVNSWAMWNKRKKTTPDILQFVLYLLKVTCMYIHDNKCARYSSPAHGIHTASNVHHLQ